LYIKKNYQVSSIKVSSPSVILFFVYRGFDIVLK